MFPASLDPPATRDWDFPRAVAGVRVLVEHGRAHGLPARALLAGTGLRPADLETETEVTARQELRAVRNLQACLGTEAGAAVGERYRAETFGVFGYAILTSRTVLDALNVALRFVDLSYAFAIPTATIVGNRVVGTLDGSSLPRDVRTFLVHRDATAVHCILRDLVPGGVGAATRLGEETATIGFDAAELTRPVATRDARALALAEELCRRVVSLRRARHGFAQDVRVLITQRLTDGAPMASTCTELGLSERTLRRRLAEQGTSYRQLLDEVRSALATELLATRSSLPLEVIASRLGYASSTALIHAHRRWTGRTPRQPGA
jgi:AraC-like DNA-binding protein